MKNQLYLLLTLLLSFPIFLSAQNSIKIIDPDWFDIDNSNGTIEEAVYTVQPQGAFMEIELYLTFSDRGLVNSPNDPLEIVFDFTLPAGSILHDSWLWMEDGVTIVKADILDIWKANSIYEDIVDRRRDPSILYRKENGAYQLRIFPLSAGQSRKVKITYLSPAIWTAEKVETWLPTEIIKASAYPPSTFQVIAIPDPTWKEPLLNEASDFPFVPVDHPVLGSVLVADINPADLKSFLNFSVKAPFNGNRYFVSQAEHGGDQFYQLAYLAPEIPQPEKPQKLAVLFDHDASFSNFQKKEVFAFVRQQLQENLNATDQFNVIFYQNSGQVTMLSDSWIPADPATLSSMLDPLTDPISNYSNLLFSLRQTIDFIQNNGGEGDILMVLSAGGVPTWEASSPDAREILELIGNSPIRIHIVDYQNKKYFQKNQWSADSELTYENHTFYQDLSQGSSGMFFNALGGAFSGWESIYAAFKNLKNQDYNFDLYTGMEDGFTFQRYYQSYMGQSKGIRQPILQVGKFLGGFPLKIEFTAATDQGFIFDSQTVEAGEIVESDTLCREIWMGQHLRNLEGSVSNNLDIQQIIDLSIEERVLSKYTAFLALDLENGGEICWNCWNQEPFIVFSTENPTASGVNLQIKASPNPFHDQCVVTFTLEGEKVPQQIQIQLFDAFGKMLANVDPMPLRNGGDMQWVWDGRDRSGRLLPGGMYFLVVQTEEDIQTVKLVLSR